MISFFNGLKTYGKKNQLKNTNALVIFLSILKVIIEQGSTFCAAIFSSSNSSIFIIYHTIPLQIPLIKNQLIYWNVIL